MSQLNSISQSPKAKHSIGPNQSNTKNNASLRSQAQNSKQKSNSLPTNAVQLFTLQQIQSQKSTIVHELSKLNKEIDSVKQQQRSKSILRKREEISNDRQAQRHAISFIAQQKLKKRELEERRRQQEENTIALLKQQAQENDKKRKMYESMLREQKRRAISIRLNEGKTKREEMKSIQKQSNFLINQLIREQSRQPARIEQHSIQVIERRPHVDFTELDKHEQEYLLLKEELSRKKQRSISISYPVKRFQKNRWAEKLTEEEKKLKEEERLKELDKRTRIEKRLKYGELISSLIVKKNKAQTEQSQQNYAHSKSKSIYVMPSSKMLKQTQSRNKKFQKSQSKPLKMRRLINSHYNCIKKEEKELSPEDRSKQKQRIERERKLRRQTSERLKKMDSEILQKTSSEPQSKYQSNFQNYLGQIKLKKKEGDNAWNSILSNEELTQEQKYTQLLRNAATLQNKAKLKEQLRENRDEVVELYLDSIQVKLAILESI